MLKIDRLTYGYDVDKIVLLEINLSFEAGNVYSVLGPNGVGKTTLLQCIMGNIAYEQGDII